MLFPCLLKLSVFLACFYLIYFLLLSFILVVEPNKAAWKKIRKEFGDSVFHTDGTLNREALGQIVFSDPDKKRLLNSITHPDIYNSIAKKCLRLFFSGTIILYIHILYKYVYTLL